MISLIEFFYTELYEDWLKTGCFRTVFILRALNFKKCFFTSFKNCKCLN